MKLFKRNEDMNINAGEDKIKKGAAALRMAAYLLAVTLVFSAVSFLCTVNAPVAPSPYSSVVDLTGIDFNSEVVTIQNTSFTMYPDAFYLPEDFAAGKVAQTDVRYNTPGVPMSDFGTLRILLALPRGEVYAIAGKNGSYAQRLFIDDKEYAPIGMTGESIEAVTPKSIRFTESFLPTGDTTEIVIHYSAFVHADGGGLYPLNIGLVRNVVRIEQLKTFRDAAVAAALITAMLFFFGLFLFFSKSRYLLWFALVCGCIALRILFVSDKAIMLLLPNLNWYLAIRMELILTCGMALFSVLYLNGLFPGASNKWAIRGFTVFCTAYTFFVCLTPSTVFTRSDVFFSAACVAFCVYLLVSVVRAAVRKKNPYPLSRAEQWLLLFGLGIYTAFSALGVYAHQRSIDLLGLDFPQVGMMVFLFLNILALSLGFARTERELDASRRTEREMTETNRMLERLDKLKTNFLANISHEIRTPLTVMGGYAQLAVESIDEGNVDGETRENLCVVSQEAQRLAALATGLLRVSAKEDEEMAWARGALSVEAVFNRAAAAFRPMLAKNNNRLKIQIEDGLPPVCANGDRIYQVLFNLTANASRHTRNGVITLNAELSEDAVIITVKDNGRGISSELLPHVFDRRVSGDGGDGLGLAICKEIVEAHGGEIGIDSTPEKGTLVTFTLPLEKEGIPDESKHIDD